MAGSLKIHRLIRVAFFLIITNTIFVSFIPSAKAGHIGKADSKPISLSEPTALPFSGSERTIDFSDPIVLQRKITTDGTLLSSKTIKHERASSPDPKVPRAEINPRQTSASDLKLNTESYPPKQVNTSEGNIVVLRDSDYFPVLLEKIENSRSSIHLAMFLFKTSKSRNNKPALIIRALAQAARRGVAIRVLLENSGHNEKLNENNQKTAKRLRKNGIRVAFDSPNITMHTKGVVIDERYVIIGSHNFTQSALKYNRELSLLVDSRNLAKELTDYMRTLESGK